MHPITRITPLLFALAACGPSGDTDDYTYENIDCGTRERVVDVDITRHDASNEAIGAGAEWASEVPCEAFCSAPANTETPPTACDHTLTEDVEAGSAPFDSAGSQDIVGQASCTYDAVILCD